jgi:hypothetical protein
MAKEKTGAGRPTLYNPKLHPKLGGSLAAQGLNDREICEKLEIVERTFYRWLKEYDDFSHEIKRGRDDQISIVKNSLFQRAKGFDILVEKPMVVSLGNNMGSEIQMATYTEKVLPDVSAIKTFLYNRDPENWKERRAVEMSGSIEIPVPLTREERAKRKKEIEEQIKNGD